MEADASRMICAKCGTQNAAGDAFCGSCGAFLEFAAEEAGAPATGVADPGVGASATTSGPPSDASAPAAAVAPQHVPMAAPPAPPVPPPSVPQPSGMPAAAPAFAASGPTCPVCGRANPAGRTFCISCGERLPAAGRAATAPARAAPARAAPAPLAAPPPATPPVPVEPPPTPVTQAWSFPSAPARPAASAGAQPGHAAVGVPAPSPARRRGGSPLPLIVGVGVLFLVLAGGGAAVLLGGKSGSASPSPAAPNASATASGAVPGSSAGGASAAGASAIAGSAGAASSAPSAAPATLPPGPAIGLKPTGATASSSLAKHAASLAIDGDPTTSWKTGTATPSDQWIEVTFAPAAVTRIQIWNGWQRTQDFYTGNHRPRNVTVRFDKETPIPLKLVDVYGSQRVDIPPELGIVGVTRLRITILDWYPAKKTPVIGSPTTQAAISEIRLYGIPMTP